MLKLCLFLDISMCFSVRYQTQCLYLKPQSTPTFGVYTCISHVVILLCAGGGVVCGAARGQPSYL